MQEPVSRGKAESTANVARGAAPATAPPGGEWVGGRRSPAQAIPHLPTTLSRGPAGSPLARPSSGLSWPSCPLGAVRRPWRVCRSFAADAGPAQFKLEGFGAGFCALLAFWLPWPPSPDVLGARWPLEGPDGRLATPQVSSAWAAGSCGGLHWRALVALFAISIARPYGGSAPKATAALDRPAPRAACSGLHRRRGDCSHPSRQ